MAYEFSFANTSYLTTASTPVTSTPMTLAGWGRATTVGANNAVVSINDAGGESAWFISFSGLDAGDPVVAVATSPALAVITATTTSGYSANVWHAASAVFASAASRTAYIDGGSAATDTATLPQPGSGHDQIIIGRWRTHAVGNVFQGRLAEIAIWNVELTAGEIASLAKGFSPRRIRPQSLVFYAPLIRDLVDMKGLAITNNNSATVADHPRTYA